MHWGSPGLSSLAVCSLVWPGHPITHLTCTELDVTCHTENTLSLCGLCWLVGLSLPTCFTLAGPKERSNLCFFLEKALR